MGRPSSIYGLYAPCGELLYVGKANDPKSRLKGHMRDSRRRNTPLYCWIRKHGAPEMRVLAENCDDWKAEERRLITEARARGEARLNVADGGDEPFCSDETRRKNGLKLAERIANDPEFARIRELKRAIKASLRSGGVSNDRRARLRAIAAIDPKMFGCFANIPDRQEAA